jgi:RND family efflux transporter MFP subunit
MKKSISTFLMAATTVAAIAGVTAAIAVHGPPGRPRGEQPAAKPALAVTVTVPRVSTIPVRIRANGNIAAWQEATIGTESAGLRLTEVKVNVGDVVKRGQVVATFEAGTVGAELSHSRAALLESEAALAEAASNAQRARYLQASGALSVQQINQLLTAERTAHARVEAAKATARSQELRLAQTSVRAPDDGVISARIATVGAVLGTGQELFRIIRKGRLEWRAEVAAPELARLKPGQAVFVTPSGGEPIKSTLRIVAPSVDTQTRNGLVYVDLPSGTTARAGMFARGEIDIGADSRAMTLPQAAVLQRDGFDYVFLVGSDSKVVQTKVMLGRRLNDRVEILAGLDASSIVVAAGGGFLSDGDLVHLVEGQAVPRKFASGSATALK